MTQKELTMEVAKLRLRVRMNSRLKLESQALLSRLFREHGVPIADELLAALVLAVPGELRAEAEGRDARTSSAARYADKSAHTPPPHPPTPPPRPHDDDDDDKTPGPHPPLDDDDDDDKTPRPHPPLDDDDDDKTPGPHPPAPAPRPRRDDPGKVKKTQQPRGPAPPRPKG